MLRLLRGCLWAESIEGRDVRGSPPPPPPRRVAVERGWTGEALASLDGQIRWQWQGHGVARNCPLGPHSVLGCHLLTWMVPALLPSEMGTPRRHRGRLLVVTTVLPSQGVAVRMAQARP